MNYAVDIKSLKVERNGQMTLDDVSCQLEAGKVIGLIGPSGAGKTTLMRAIVGVQQIAGGSVTVLGLSAGSKALRSTVGYVTQAPSVYGDLTVRQNLAYFAKILNVGQERIGAVIAQVKLDQQADLRVDHLSGGQHARVSLAVAMLGAPKLLVLDEPTVGLDPVLREDLWGQFHDLAKTGVSLVISSHVMDEAERCEQLLLIRDGQIVANDTPKAICQATGTKSVEQAFLKIADAAT
jgi:ABC-2 type transport system ATP-binding protein